ncbi:conjugal transfer protein TrbH [Neorhizobium sp. BT27B]|uniref:conjugal transfer protein TrbH n=1 Tax=Neorhizobium sp. BT27B TaxID=3142625 RepID=UPI003D26D769
MCRFPTAFIFIVLSLSACHTSTEGLSESIAPSNITGPAASTIAGDMAARYAEQAGSTGATIRLHSEASDFAVAFEAALKGWGYVVVTDDKQIKGPNNTERVELAYSLVSIDGQVLARLSTDTLELGRAYTVTNSVATPASPLSLMKRN